MDNPKDDKYYIRKIIEDLEYIIEHTKDAERKDFFQNELLTNYSRELKPDRC